MTDQQAAATAPTAMGTAVEFSMAWLATQGDIGQLVQRTLITALQDNDQLQKLLQGQTHEIATLRGDLEELRSTPKQSVSEKLPKLNLPK